MGDLKYIEFKDNPHSREINNSIRDIISFCEVNQIDDVDYFMYNCMLKGYYIEKYGLLNEELTLPETIYVESNCDEIQKKYDDLNDNMKQTISTLNEIKNKNNSLLEENTELKKVITSRLARYHQSSNIKK